jgi:hypothetical protein
LIFFCYRQREARAAELAREIEGSGSNKLGIELENGDEEEAFSAVVRSGPRGTTFYIQPFSKVLLNYVAHCKCKSMTPIWDLGARFGDDCKANYSILGPQFVNELF